MIADSRQRAPSSRSSVTQGRARYGADLWHDTHIPRCSSSYRLLRLRTVVTVRLYAPICDLGFFLAKLGGAIHTHYRRHNSSKLVRKSLAEKSTFALSGADGVLNRLESALAMRFNTFSLRRSKPLSFGTQNAGVCCTKNVSALLNSRLKSARHNWPYVLRIRRPSTEGFLIRLDAHGEHTRAPDDVKEQ